MNTRLFALSLGLLATVAVADEDPAAPSTAGYHLKNKSTFAAEQKVRSPFWPIGWTPTTKGQAPAAVAQQVTLKQEMFAVTSILLGSQSYANINGRTYGEGELLRLPRAPKTGAGAPAAPTPAPAAAAGAAGKTAAPAAPTAPIPPDAKIRVARINDGEVVLQCGTQTLAVPLRRAQLLERKPGGEDELLLGQADQP